MINFALNNTKYVLSLNKHVIELLGLMDWIKWEVPPSPSHR